MKLLSVQRRVGIRKLKNHESAFEGEDKEKKATGDIKKTYHSCRAVTLENNDLKAKEREFKRGLVNHMNFQREEEERSVSQLRT